MPIPLWDLLDFALTWLYRFLEYLVSLAGQVPGLSVSGPAPVLICAILIWLLVWFIQKRDAAYRNSVASFD